MQRLLISYFIAIIAIITNLFCSNTKFGFYSSFLSTWNEGDLRKFESINDTIPRIASGDNVGIGLGIFDELQLSKRLLLGLKLGGYFQKIQMKNTKLTDSSELGYTLGYNNYSISFQPSIMYNLFPNFSVFWGLEANYNLLSNVSLREYKIEKSNLTEKRIYSKEAIPPFAFNLVVGVKYQIPYTFFRTLQLGFSSSYTFGFSRNFVSFTNDIKSLNFTIYASITKHPISLTTPIKEPVIPELPSPKNNNTFNIIADSVKTIKIDVNYVCVEGHQILPPNLTIESNVIEYTFPLLNYVFFDYADDKIPSRYKLLKRNEVKNFELFSLRLLNPLEVYWNILNIVGYRMNEFPQAKIEIIGCNSNFGVETENLSLSERRARQIFRYLNKVWEIDTSRMTIKYQNLPDIPTNNTLPEGRQENQRVEIRSNFEEILTPFVVIDTVRNVKPNTLRFYFRIDDFDTSKEILANISIKCKNENILISDFILKTPYDSLDILLDKFIKSGDPFPLDFKIAFSSTKNPNFNKEYTGSIPVIFQHRTENFGNENKIKVLNLILFDFNSASLTNQQIQILQKYIPIFEKSKKLKVVGYTDKIGNPEYNLILSKSRAETVAKEIGISNIEVVGLGENVELFNNQLPEGRFYSRIVQIVY